MSVILPSDITIHMPDHLSVSQLNTFIRCGYRWAYEHRSGTRTYDPGWDARLRGQCLDVAATEHFRQKVLNGVGITLGQIQDIAVAEHQKYEDATMFSMNEGLSRDRAAAQAAVYHKTFGQMFSALAVDDVQKTVDYKDDDLDIGVVGIIDLIHQGSLIIDTKIKKKIPAAKEVHLDWQFTTYSFMTGIKNVAWAVITDERSPRAELIPSVRMPSQWLVMKAIYNQAWAAIQAGNFTPAEQNHWLCNEKWCPHWGYCPMGRANEIEMVEVPGLEE